MSNSKLSIPPPPPSSDSTKQVVAPNEEEEEDDLVHVNNRTVSDLDGLVGALDRHVNDIRKRYRNLHKQLDEREKRDIEAFYSRVHSGLDERQPGYGCPIS